jgi:putative methyltransferase (TIGR04325 family)
VNTTSTKPRAVLVPDPFATSGWLSHCRAYSDAIGVRRNLRARIRHLLARAAPLDALDFLVRRPLPEHLETPAQVLRQLVAQHGQARVLDLGGGFGDNFHLLEAGLGADVIKDVDYVVVDNEASCELGRSAFRPRRHRPRFETTIPAQTFDLVLLVGTLQYVLGWQELLTTLASHGRSWLCLARSPLSLDRPTFFSLQSICPAMGESQRKQVGVSPVVIVNKDELLAATNGLGWTLDRTRFHADYSANFSRLPGPRSIAYLDLLWRPTA